MKLLKPTLLITCLLTLTSVSAQDSKEKAAKKLKWMDTDKNGSVSKDEMIAFHKGKKDKKGRPVKAEDIFIGTDHNNDGKITVDEFEQKIDWNKVKELKKKGKAKSKKKGNNDLPTDKVARKLHWMDKNKNNSVDLNEMKAFFKGKKDKKGNPINAGDMFFGFDANDDGKVTLEELKKGVNWKKINKRK